MTVECPICRAENESDSRICVKCATPFDMQNPAIAWPGASDPGETIALSPPGFPSSSPSPAGNATLPTLSGEYPEGRPGGDPGKSWSGGDQPSAKSVIAPGYVLAG